MGEAKKKGDAIPIDDPIQAAAQAAAKLPPPQPSPQERIDRAKAEIAAVLDRHGCMLVARMTMRPVGADGDEVLTKAGVYVLPQEGDG